MLNATLPSLIWKFAGPLPRACQIIRGEALWILTSTFHFYNFCLFFEIFAIEANSNSHFRLIFRNQRHGREFEQHLELELLFLVWEVRTRGGCQGASGHGHRVLFESRGHPFFEAIFWMVFFSKLLPNGTLNCIKKLRKSDDEIDLERGRQNMLKMS